MLKVIDLFAGAGGFGLGFQLADYAVTCSVEVDKWATDTLRENNPGMKVIHNDITTFQSSEIIRQICSDSPDIIIGGPPCQGFSIAGPTPKDPKDPRNSLFQNFVFWVESLNPQMFVMENVKGILSRKNADGEKVIDIIQNAFEDLEYKTDIWELNAAKYGVPQLRERVFIVGNRFGITKIEQPVKTHFWASQNGEGAQSNINNSGDFDNLLPAIPVWDALSDLPELEAGDGEEEQPYTMEPQTDFQRWARANQEILFNHVAMKHTERLVERFKHIGSGQSVLDVPEEHGARKRGGNGVLSDASYGSNNRRFDPEKPSYTIPASFYSSFIHPYQHRNITAREAARLQSFPDCYRFVGKRTIISQKLLERKGRHDEIHLSQYNQIGNAVPPLLAKAIAEHIRPILDNSTNP